MKALAEFKDYLFTARALDLAIGVVLGLAFGTVITSLVGNMLTPWLAVFGEVDFSELAFQIGGGTFRYGQLINDIIGFGLVAVAVFFVVVKPREAYNDKLALEQTDTRICEACLSTVPLAARRCAFCGEEHLPRGTTAADGKDAELQPPDGAAWAPGAGRPAVARPAHADETDQASGAPGLGISDITG